MNAACTFGIDFIARKVPANPLKRRLYAKVTVNGDAVEISLKQLVNPKDWDSRKECMVPKTPEAQAVNSFIENMRFLITQKYRLLIDKEETVTAEKVKVSYLGNQSSKPKQPTGHTLLELFLYHNKINGTNAETGENGVLAEGTMKNYRTSLEYVRLYIQQCLQKQDIFLSELNYELIEGFEHYIRNFPIKNFDPCKGNGVYKHMERLHKIIRLGKKLKWMKDDPFEGYEMKKTKPRRKKLDIDDLVRIESQIFVDPKISYVKELFLFSCYTGLAYADTLGLTPLDIKRADNGVIWLDRYRKKSNELSSVPVLEAARNILNKYWTADKGMNDQIFPYVSNQEVNRNLKIIQATCNIFKEMTFHIARHTFATTVTLKNGVPIETVSKMLGHTKLTTTQIYAEVDEEKIADDMNGVEELLNVKKANRITNSGQNFSIYQRKDSKD